MLAYTCPWPCTKSEHSKGVNLSTFLPPFWDKLLRTIKDLRRKSSCSYKWGSYCSFFDGNILHVTIFRSLSSNYRGNR